MPDHYFTADPASPDERVERTVRLAGREVVVETAPGIFSPGGLDKATAILLEEAPDPVPTGAILDLGCGWGPIALSLAGVRGLGEAAVLLSLKDNSEESKLKRQVAQATKMQAIGQLAGGVAHDFNNILTAIIGHCDLMLMRHTPGDSDYDDIQQIRQNSNRAAGLTNRVLSKLAGTVMTGFPDTFAGEHVVDAAPRHARADHPERESPQVLLGDRVRGDHRAAGVADRGGHARDAGLALGGALCPTAPPDLGQDPVGELRRRQHRLLGCGIAVRQQDFGAGAGGHGQAAADRHGVAQAGRWLECHDAHAGHAFPAIELHTLAGDLA